MEIATKSDNEQVPVTRVIPTPEELDETVETNITELLIRLFVDNAIATDPEGFLVSLVITKEDIAGAQEELDARLQQEELPWRVRAVSYEDAARVYMFRFVTLEETLNPFY